MAQINPTTDNIPVPDNHFYNIQYETNLYNRKSSYDPAMWNYTTTIGTTSTGVSGHTNPQYYGAYAPAPNLEQVVAILNTLNATLEKEILNIHERINDIERELIEVVGNLLEIMKDK